MRPEDRQIQSGDPRGSVQPPKRDNSAAQSAAADIARSQLDSIYSGEPAAAATTPEGQALPTTYRRTHDAATTANQKEWQDYHSAWQEYYQKYYEQYYVGAVNQVHQAYSHHTASLKNQPTAATPETEKSDVSRDEAIEDLRAQLLSRVKSAGKRVRKSRHFVPITAALVVLVLFSFLQYNRAIIANVKAYITPGEIDPQNIVVDPNASLQVSQDPRLIIPKINVNVPVVYNTTPDQASQLKAMENGVAYFGIPGADSKPGQVGNTVISGHSSNDFIETGNYKFVFALLERLKPGDIFYLHYNGIRYTYNITKTRVVKPTDVSALVYPTTKPEATLITCTPLGTALNRLLVTGEQVSPDPATATAAPTSSGSDKGIVMPSNSPTLLEKLFGG